MRPVRKISSEYLATFYHRCKDGCSHDEQLQGGEKSRHLSVCATIRVVMAGNH